MYPVSALGVRALRSRTARNNLFLLQTEVAKAACTDGFYVAACAVTSISLGLPDYLLVSAGTALVSRGSKLDVKLYRILLSAGAGGGPSAALPSTVPSYILPHAGGSF